MQNEQYYIFTNILFFELHVLLFHIAILSCSSFIQLYFYFKLFMMCLAILIYIVGLHWHNIYECLAESIKLQTNLPFLKMEIIIQMFFYVIFLHMIDRRVSYYNIFLIIRVTCFILSFFKLD